MATSPPHSLLLLDSPAPASTSGRALDEAPLGPLFLHAGLANGVLLRSEVWRPQKLQTLSGGCVC